MTKAPFERALVRKGKRALKVARLALVPGAPDFNYRAQLDYSVTSLTRVSAPEIDPASAASDLTLLLGGLVVLRGRRKLVTSRGM